MSGHLDGPRPMLNFVVHTITATECRVPISDDEWNECTANTSGSYALARRLMKNEEGRIVKVASYHDSFVDGEVVDAGPRDDNEGGQA